ncbi:hypothetical protein V6N13_102554 [Hibiscus sabdariffa]
MVREYMGLNYEAAGEGFGDVNSEGGARWGFEGVSASSARIVMKVEQDGAFGGHLGVVVAEISEVNEKRSEIKVHNQDRPGWAIAREADEPAASPESSSKETREAEAPEIRRLGKHRASDSSAAGGGVIVGGLATVVFVAIFAYIRVTRKSNDVQVQQH